MPEKRKPGRPPVDPAGRAARINLTVDAADYDRLSAQAQREEKPVSALVRELVERRLAPSTKP